MLTKSHRRERTESTERDRCRERKGLREHAEQGLGKPCGLQGTIPNLCSFSLSSSELWLLSRWLSVQHECQQSEAPDTCRRDKSVLVMIAH